MRTVLTLSAILIFIITDCRFKTTGCLTCPPGPTDTTSHNFTWTLQHFGDGASSAFNDVAIINDTLAYAVGAVYFKDSLGVWDPLPYNLAKWDGTNWELKRVTVNFRGSMITPALEGISVFSPTDIWFVGSLPIHGDGQNWVMYDLRSLPGLESISLSKAWGTSSSSIYFIGRGGSLVYYNGSTWTKIESGTALNIYDIYGAYNYTTRQWEVIAVAGNVGSSSERKILKITGTTAAAISDNPIAWSLEGVWFVPCQHYYVVGSGIYEKRNLSDNTWLNNPLDITTYYTTHIRGNAINDIFVVGAYGEVLHYNGNSWHSYISTTGINGSYGPVAIRNNLVMIVGYDNDLAVITKGVRIP
jgi:hypothetical protein